MKSRHLTVENVKDAQIRGGEIREVDGDSDPMGKINGKIVYIDAEKLMFVPEEIIRQRARLRALLATGFATGDEDERRANTFRLTRVLDEETIGQSTMFKVFVNTPF